MRRRSERSALHSWFWLRGHSLFPHVKRRAAGSAVLFPLAALVTLGARDGTNPDTRFPADAVRISIDSVRVFEGDSGTVAATFTLRLSEPLDSSGATMRFATDDGTAEGDSDYIPAIGTVTLNRTDLFYTIEVRVTGDSKVEGNEHFVVLLRDPPPGAVLADSVGTCTIVDDDRPVISIDAPRVLEGDGGTVEAVFTVRLSALLEPGGTLSFTTEDRTAQAGSDYVPVTGVLTLSPLAALRGDARDVGPVGHRDDDKLSFSIVVPLIGDTVLEGNERFALRLSNPPPGAVLADNVGICTIVNDERTRLDLSRAGLRNFVGALGPAFGDANGDGHPDLPLETNLGNGEFVTSPGLSALVISGFHHGSAWCDYDRDGRLDLLVMPYNVSPSDTMPLQLLHNLGDDAYEDVAPRLGMAVVGRGETAVWGDFDGDGWPDLFAPFYAYLPPYRSFMWRNNHDGTFTEIAVQAGVALAGVPESLKPEGADAADMNGDGTLDLYCASHLFLNDGAGHFTDVRALVGLPQVFDEGAKLVDIDNDGDLDLYLRTAPGPRLFGNQGGTFAEVTAAAGLPPRPFYWGDSWADVDNDGDVDLLLVNTSPYPTELYLNQGNGTFVSDTAFAAAGFSNFLSAWADVDDDGDLDAAFGATDRRLLMNQLDPQPGGWLRVWVLDALGHANCYGTTARLKEIGGGPGTIQTRVVDGGSGYLTQGGYALHFAGLGHARYSLEVRYPGPQGGETVVDGTTNPVLANLDPDQLPYPNLFVFRNGRVLFGPIGGPKALAVSPAGRSTPGKLAATGKLAAPGPAPARGTVYVPVRLEALERADLTVHDLLGRRVRALAHGLTGEGSHSIPWDLRDDQGGSCPNGVYFIRLAVDGRTAGQRPIAVLR